MMGTLAWTQRKLIVTTSRTKRSTDFIAHLQALDHLYGPKPGTPIKPVVMVLDNGPIHVSKAHGPRSPSVPIGSPSGGCRNMLPNSTTSRSSGDLKAHHLAHQTFTDPDVLDESINHAVDALNSGRKRNPLGNQRISA